MDQLQRLDQRSRRRVVEIAQELSGYGLAIAAPHMHSANGEIVALPTDIAAYEDKLQVSFVTEEYVTENAVAVGWRWIDGTLRVFAGCCGHNMPRSQSAR